MPEVPLFASERFRKPFRELRVTDIYDPNSGWRKLPRGTVFGRTVASELVDQGVTQVRLKSRREMHEVSILALAKSTAAATAAADSETESRVPDFPQ